MVIDEKLFTHINNDAFLAGSFELEGNQFSSTIAYLDNYLKMPEQAQLAPEITKLRDACTGLASIANELESYSAIQAWAVDGKVRDLALQKASEVLTSNPGDYTLLPGGWSDGSGGHAMVYQLEKDSNGDILLSVNNSGAGLSFHPRMSVKDKEVYCPVITYRIPKNDASKSTLSSLLYELFIPNLPAFHSASRIDANYLYKTVFSYVESAGGVLEGVSPEQQKLWWYTTGQHSGTCTQSSLHQMLKQRFQSLDDYRRFIYGFKQHALHDYMSQSRKNGQIKEKKYREPIVKAIRHNLRLLNAESETEGIALFEAEKIQQDMAVMSGYLSELSALDQKEVASHTCSLADITLNEDCPLSMDQVVRQPEVNAQHEQEEAITVIDGKYQQGSMIEFMISLVEKCSTAKNEPMTVIRALEQFFNTIPLSGEARFEGLLSEINCDEAVATFFKLIQLLKDIYLANIQKQCGSNYHVRVSVTRLSMLAFTHEVCQKLNLCHPGAMLYRLGTAKSLRESIDENPCMASNNYFLDNRIITLSDKYKSLAKEEVYDAIEMGLDYQMDSFIRFPCVKKWLETSYNQRFEDDHTPFHRALRSKNATAFWYFHNHVDINTSPQATSKELEEEWVRFIKHKKIISIIESIALTEKGVLPCAKNDNLVFGEYEGRLYVEERNNREGNLLPDYDAPLSKYTVYSNRLNRENREENVDAYETLLALSTGLLPLGFHCRRSRTDNGKQLSRALRDKEDPVEVTLQYREKINLWRELEYISEIPELKPFLALDYFSKNLELLSQKNLRIYLEACLFQPGILHNIITNHEKCSAFLKMVDDFTIKALEFHQYNSDKKENKIASFLIKVKALLSCYLSDSSPDQYRARVTRTLEKINALINHEATSDNHVSLHESRLMLLANLAQQSEFTCDEDYITMAIESQVIVKNRQITDEIDSDSILQLEQASHVVSSVIQQQIKLGNITNSSISQLFLRLETLKNYTCNSIIQQEDNSFLVATDSETIRLDVVHGRLRKGYLSLTQIPSALVNSPVFKKLKLSPGLGLSSADNTVIEYEQGSRKYRFIKDPSAWSGSPYKIQFKLKENSTSSRWHELKMGNYSTSSYYGLDSYIINSKLPESLNDVEHFWWVSENGTCYITQADGTPIYSGVSTGDNQWAFTDGAGHKLCRQSEEIEQLLSHFESSQFIEAKTNSAGKLHAIHLPRYNLLLQADTAQQQLFIDWQGSRYQIIEQSEVIGEGVCSLHLKSNDQECLLIPMQPLIATDKRSKHSEYTILMQDTSNQVLNEKARGMAISHANSQTVLSIKLKDGKPCPETTDQALMLCYLYLGSNKIDKAWEALVLCDKELGGLKGTADEVGLINWIVNSLPTHYKKRTQQKTLQTPQVSACQLKSLHLLVKLKRNGKAIRFDEKRNYPLGYEDQATKALESTRHLYECLGEQIKQTYSSYRKLQDELPSEYALTDSERLDLLREYHESSTKDISEISPVGALGYDWVELKCKQLGKEVSALESQQLSEADEQRLALIRQTTETQSQIRQKISRLSPVAISLPLDCDIGDYGQMNVIKTESLPDGQKAEEAMQSLNTTLSFQSNLQGKKTLEVVFYRNVPHYLQLIAYDAERKASIQSISKRLLIKYRNAWEPEDKVKLNIARFLYQLSSSNASITRQYLQDCETIRDVWDKVLGAHLSTPQVYVLEHVDCFSPMRIETQQILQEAKTRNKEPVPINLSEPHLQTLNRSSMNDWFTKKIRQQCSQWQTLSSTHDNPPSTHSQFTEQEKSAHQIKALNAMRVMSENLLHPDFMMELQRNLTLTTSINDHDLLQAESYILTLVANNPRKSLANLRKEVDLLSHRQAALSMAELVALYFNNDMNLYISKTGLDKNGIIHLHQEIARYLSLLIKKQYLDRVQKACTKCSSPEPNTSKQKENAYKLATVLFSNNKVPILEDPELAVFQLHSKFLYRPRQVEACRQFLGSEQETRIPGYRELITQIMMGGGKSKVILPTIAQKKANGKSLVIIEVPKSLLHTNYIDLHASSAKLFDQKAVKLEFSRDSDCSLVRLQQLEQQLIDTMVNKHYLVTTGESIQSIELKFLELLSHKPKTASEDLSEWRKKVATLNRIVALFKQHGDCLIDEVHQGLELRHQLNYTFGKPTPLEPFVVEHSLDLYQFLSKVPLDSNQFPGHELETLTCRALLSHHKLITVPEQIKYVINQLRAHLLRSPSSPLAAVINNLLKASPSRKEMESRLSQLNLYLENNCQSIPDFVQSASPDIQSMLAFYKAQLSTFLPNTLVKNQGEDYGPSQETSIPYEHAAISIPYLANNVPNERSRFGNPIKVTNCTIQSLLITGASRSMIRSLIKEWQNKAIRELRSTAANSIISTNSNRHAMTVLNECEPFNVMEINLEDEEVFERMYRKLAKNEECLFELLRNNILPNIKKDDRVLQSNALNHVELYHSCQGMSGTPYNAATFHSRLLVNENELSQNDEYVYQGLKSKSPEMLTIDNDDAEIYIRTLLTKGNQTKNLRAIIDISASLRDCTNLQAARSIAKYIKDHPSDFNRPEPVQHVLFFNTSGTLCAIDINNNIESQEPIEVGSSEESVILQRLGSAPSARFSLYDQFHIIGTDIMQMPQAKALALIDQDTQHHNLLQGCLRFREVIEGGQTVDFVTPSELSGIPLDHIWSNCKDKTAYLLAEQSFHKSMSEIDCKFRSLLISEMLKLSGESEQAINKQTALRKTFKEYFESSESKTFFERYGGIDEEVETRTLLLNRQHKVMQDWRALNQLLDKQVGEADEEKFSSELIPDLEKALQRCPERQKQKVGLSLDVEVETEQETEVETELEQELQKQIQKRQYKPAKFNSWLPAELDDSNVQARLPPTFNEVYSTCIDSEIFINFSEHLHVTDNFYLTYEDQSDHLDRFCKPVHSLFFKKTDGGLECTILCQQEAKEFYKSMEKSCPNNCWLATAGNTVLAGKAMENFKDDREYQTLIEQVRFFAGDLSLLTEEPRLSPWLTEDFDRKLEFYEKAIAPVRTTKKESLSEFKLQIEKQMCLPVHSESNKILPTAAKTQEAQVKLLYREEPKRDMIATHVKLNTQTNKNQQPTSKSDNKPNTR